jgi:hypothetical protein
MDFIWAVFVAIWGVVIVVQLLGIGRLLERIDANLIEVQRRLGNSELDRALIRINSFLDRVDRSDDWRDL